MGEVRGKRRKHGRKEITKDQEEERRRGGACSHHGSHVKEPTEAQRALYIKKARPFFFEFCSNITTHNATSTHLPQQSGYVFNCQALILAGPKPPAWARLGALNCWACVGSTYKWQKKVQLDRTRALPTHAMSRHRPYR